MAPARITRRRFGAVAGGALASLAFGAACHGKERAERNDGRLAAHPRNGVRTSATGTRSLGLGGDRDAIVQIPAGRGGPLPLVVLFHGAGQSAEWMMEELGAAAGEAGVAVLAPNSRESSWDAVGGEFGADVTYLDRALDRVFDTVAVDAARVAAVGFSDGATYALSLGLINGDLFRRVVAFSPGFVVAGPSHGRPQFFISHGTADRILPIDQCSRRIVPALRKRGYEVTFREFDGGHGMPDAIAREALQWTAAPNP